MKLTFYIAIQQDYTPEQGKKFPFINETHLGGEYAYTTFIGFVHLENWGDLPPLHCIRIDIDGYGVKAADVTKDVAAWAAGKSRDFRHFASRHWLDFYDAQGISDPQN